MDSRYLRFFGLFLVILFLYSCEYKLIEFDEPTDENISFAEDIIPILNNKCNVSGCHTVGHYVVDLTPANAYNDLKAKSLIDPDYPSESQFYKILTSVGSTHTGRSTPSEQQLILKWLQEGATDN